MPIEPTIATTLPTDSLVSHSSASVVEVTTDSLAVGLGGLFGPEALLTQQTTVSNIAPFTLTNNWVVGLMLVALFVAYLFVLYAYGGHVGQMVKIILGDNIGIRVADELSYLYMRAVRSSVFVGVALWSLVGIKFYEIAHPEALLPIDALWLGPCVVVGVLAVGTIQRILSGGICNLVRRVDLARGLNILADTSMALVAIVATPIGLLFVANVGSSAVWFGVATLVVASVGLILFGVKSLIFFLEQKISILLWFLYLCTVVLIPIGIILTLVVRMNAV